MQTRCAHSTLEFANTWVGSPVPRTIRYGGIDGLDCAVRSWVRCWPSLLQRGICRRP